MERWAGKTAIVTGASTGIGAAIAVTLANQGLHVVGVARRQQLVDDLKRQVTGPGSLCSRKCDVSNPTEVEALFEWVQQTLGGVDVMVNNAGVIYHGNITELGPNPVTVEEMMQQLDVNIKSIVLCSRLAVSDMKRRSVAGHIVNVNSIIGHYVPNSDIFNVYCPSKHAVTGFTKTLRNELALYKSAIKTTSLSPGLVNTQMAELRKMTDSEIAALVVRAPKLQPQDVADSLVYAISTPPHVNIDELTITPVGKRRL